MRRRLLLPLMLVLLLAPGAPARAGDIDCTRPAGTAERTICNTPALRRADADLAALYRRVQTATPYPIALADAQQGWLRTRNAARGIDAIQAAYQDRMRELALLAAQLDAVRAAIAPENLDTICLPLREDGNPDGESCSVIGFGDLGGGLVYQLQDWLGDPAQAGSTTGGGSAVLRRAGGRLVPVAWVSGPDAQYGTPQIVRTDTGETLLVLPGTADGDLQRNAGRLLQLHGADWGADWHEVDDLAWLNELRYRLPRGLEIRRGIFPDYAALQAETPLWRITDADTDTPTGGSATIELALRRNQLVIRDLTVEPADPARPVQIR